MANQADFNGILNETVAILSDNARDVGLFTLVIGGLTAIGVLAGLTETTSMAFSVGFMVDANDTSLSSLFDTLLGVFSIVAGYMLVKRFLASRGSLRSDVNRFWPYLGLLILWIIGLVVGLLLLVIPGIILVVRWSAATGFVIGEQRGVFESFKASWNATKGHGWAIFFAGIVTLIVVVMIAGVIGSIFAAISLTASGIVGAFLEAFSNALGLAFTIAVYVLVSDNAKELEEVFS